MTHQQQTELVKPMLIVHIISSQLKLFHSHTNRPSDVNR